MYNRVSAESYSHMLELLTHALQLLDIKNVYTARIRWFIADLDHRPRDLRNRRRSRALRASRDLVLNIVNVPHDVARYGPLIYAAVVEKVDLRLQRAALSTRPAFPKKGCGQGQLLAVLHQVCAG